MHPRARVRKSSHRRQDPSHPPFRAGDIRHSLADVSLARRLLGYEPAVRVRAGLERSAEWYARSLGAAA